jgi:hypothetical protein
LRILNGSRAAAAIGIKRIESFHIFILRRQRERLEKVEENHRRDGSGFSSIELSRSGPAAR